MCVRVLNSERLLNRYDIEEQKVISRAHAHKDDVNSVCFVDDSDQVYLSGSDDCMIKVWDRRVGEDGPRRAQGKLPGHTEGITYVPLTHSLTPKQASNPPILILPLTFICWSNGPRSDHIMANKLTHTCTHMHAHAHTCTHARAWVIVFSLSLPSLLLVCPFALCAPRAPFYRYLSPKGDGRYFISNSKDQKCKLWDIRAMCNSTNSQINKETIPKFFWDYRWQPYPGNPEKVKHPHDRSIFTFTGHRVLQTLIRCRWSPLETTGQRYIFSGSQCGSLFVYDILTGERTAVLRFHRSVMRDCDWHPRQPLLASVGWDGSVVRWRKLAGDDEGHGADHGADHGASLSPPPMEL